MLLVRNSVFGILNLLQYLKIIDNNMFLGLLYYYICKKTGSKYNLKCQTMTNHNIQK